MQPHSEAREGVHTALLAVDDADRRPALETRLAQRSDGLGGRSARRDDVLDQADALAGLERALDPVRRCRSPSPRPRTIRNGSREASDAAAASATAPELGAGEAHARRARASATWRRGGAERLEQVRLRLEAVLVEVVASSACPSGGRSRPRGRRARGSPRAAQHRPRTRLRVVCADAAGASGSSGRRLGRAVGERDHRAVLEVDVDPVAAPRASGGAARRRPRASPRRAQRRRAPTPRHRPRLRPSASRAAASASASLGSERRAGSS